MKQLRNAADHLLYSRYTRLTSLIENLRFTFFPDIPQEKFIADDSGTNDRIRTLRLHLSKHGYWDGAETMAHELDDDLVSDQVAPLQRDNSALQAMIDEYQSNAVKFEARIKELETLNETMVAEHDRVCANFQREIERLRELDRITRRERDSFCNKVSELESARDILVSQWDKAIDELNRMVERDYKLTNQIKRLKSKPRK